MNIRVCRWLYCCWQYRMLLFRHKILEQLVSFQDPLDHRMNALFCGRRKMDSLNLARFRETTAVAFQPRFRVMVRLSLATPIPTVNRCSFGMSTTALVIWHAYWSKARVAC